MAKRFDLTLLPLYRLRGNELPSPPGLLALSPPRRKARTRSDDRLFVHLNLSGNAPFSTVNYLHMTSHAAEAFYQSAGSVTSALRAAVMTLNGELLEQNMAYSGQGYSLGQLVLGAVRGEQLYLLIAGPLHFYWMDPEGHKEIFEPELSGRGLGLSQGTNFYLTQISLRTGGRFLISSTLSKTWKEILLRNRQSAASLETLRNVLMRQSVDDQNAVLADVEAGRGEIKLLKAERADQPTLASISKKIAEEPQVPEPQMPSHSPEPRIPSPRAVADDVEDENPLLDSGSKPPQAGDIPASIPRKMPEIESIPQEEAASEQNEEEIPTAPPKTEIVAREGARAIATGIKKSRERNEKVKGFLRKMLPRILPASDSETPLHMPAWVMALIAVIIPLIVVTIASVVYFQFGRDLQFESYLQEAQIARVRAVEQEDPVAKRIAWEDVLQKVDTAEKYDSNRDSAALRSEARAALDELLGIARLEFYPALIDLPKNIHITRLAATDTELFMLDSISGAILRAYRVGDGYQYDDEFICQPDELGGKTIGKLQELLALPASNAMGASVLGIDSKGNLLYCAAKEMPKVDSLPMPPVGLQEVTAAVLDNDILYLLDAPSKEIWVYSGQSSVFINSYPTSFFEQAPQEIGIAIDMSVRGQDLYLLFADGNLASCTYSLLNTVPTRCVSPARLIDPHPAAGGNDIFNQSLFTQLHLSAPPDSTLLLLAADTQAVLRFSPRSFELQNQVHPLINSIPGENLTAMTTNAGRVLFIAQGSQVYLIPNMP